MNSLIRYSVVSILFLLTWNSTSAHHIKGGWIGYKYVGAGSASNSSQYQVTVYLYVSCTETGPTQQVILGVFNGATNVAVSNKTIRNTTSYNMTKKSFSPCMTNPPSICYNIYTYVTTIELPNISQGYTLAVQDALRIDGIVNISNSGSSGITFTATIPGTYNGTNYNNNSPDFDFLDTVIACHSTQLSIPFSAKDPDGDSLSYSFGNGLNVSNPSQNTSSSNPSSPPYPSLTYVSGYSGATPLGVGVTINPQTGLISGPAPSTVGEYDVTVYVKEWRKGVLLDSVKKELQVQIANCQLSAATLDLSYINCEDYTFTFQNQSSTSISNYTWYFDYENNPTIFSTATTPTYTYADTGTYVLKLKVSNTAGCTDSTTSSIKVYPGFKPDFSTAGSCYQSPINFLDNSYAKYGYINSWYWNLGDAASSSNTSTDQNTSHQYSQAMTTNATLTVTSSKGCEGSVTHQVVINNKPSLNLSFADTLICSNDPPLLLTATSDDGASFTWTPNYRITNASTATPSVSPLDTTTYQVVVNNNGCVDTGYVTVNVLDYIDVQMTDTIACIGDVITLHPKSDALSYSWTQTSGNDPLDTYNTKNPSINITGNNSYRVDANLGHCQANANITIRTAAYPTVLAGNDTTICSNGHAYLYATTSATNYQWTPINIFAKNATVYPSASTNYIITVQNPNSYCPKSVSDTQSVIVIAPIVVNLGNDTTIVLGQPLQLHAATNNESANIYTWAPASLLDNAGIQNPNVAIPAGITSVDYTVKASTNIGCTGTDNIKVTIFQTGPDIFIPSGFTPNMDGVNDKLIPVCVGIKQFDFFKIYNRWGQLVFSTSQQGDGWNGNFKGAQQSAGTTFVYMAEGWDYNGNKIFKKGTVALLK